MTAEDVLNFWFKELQPQQWWVKDQQLDETIKSRFSVLHQQACAGELYTWRESAKASLAEIIILDQFSRNIYRDTPASFTSDPLALSLAQTAIAKGFDKTLPLTERGFMYLPFMHSESQHIHEVAVELFTSLGKPEQLDFEYQHKRIIDRFGRYPHRNSILGRASSAQELDFLTQENSSF
ncbi:DUF924 family protein [Shewanella maritima]|uniref:DUF924 family protein n=1 Tax=Shewanella maritima TaxID=2520507 RepID=UPI003735F0AB